MARNSTSTFSREMFAGLREVEDELWLVSFLNYDLGFFDGQEDRVEPATNHFAPAHV